MKGASVVGAMDLDPDDFLCDFVGVVLKLRQWALQVYIHGAGRTIWLQRQKAIVEERTDGTFIIHIPASVAETHKLSHPFLGGYVQQPIVLNPKPITDFNLSPVNYDEGIDDGYVG